MLALRHGSERCDSSATCMYLSLTMRDSHSVRDLKQMYTKAQPGTSLDEIIITHSGRVLEDNDLSINSYGVPPGEYNLASLGNYRLVSLTACDYVRCFATVVQAVSVKDSEGKVVRVILALRHGSERRDSSATGMCLSVTMRDSLSVRDLKQMYTKAHPGTSLDEIIITHSGRVLEDNDLSINRYGVPPGEYCLISLGNYCLVSLTACTCDYAKCFAVIQAVSVKDLEGKVVSIRIRSLKPSEKCPDLEFRTVRLSCDSHPYTSSERKYAGFILYGWADYDGYVKQDWRLGSKHCKSAYMVIQRSGKGAQPYEEEAKRAGLGQIHGAVYWNVFGKGRDPRRAVGEGFSVTIGHIWGYTFGELSSVFNINNDPYHDSKREMAKLTKQCVKEIVDRWYYKNACGETFYVKDLVN